MLEKIFKLKQNKTSVTTELIAGLTTFMAISYIIFINPAILSKTGMDYNSVYVATILASMIGTMIVGFFANVPYVQRVRLECSIYLHNMWYFRVYLAARFSHGIYLWSN